MRIRCNNCGRSVTRNNKTVDRVIEKLGIEKEDYLKIYLCRQCRIKLIKTSIFDDWFSISCIPNLPNEFIEKYKDKVHWPHISKYQKLSEEFIEKFKDKVYWYHISKYQKLSEEFIDKYKDKINWYCISRFQKLSEEFIEKFKNKVWWYQISRYQKLSPEFVLKHIDKIAMDIFNNPCYKTFPEPVKLLLKQKFGS
jgi:hypothetical protein